MFENSDAVRNRLHRERDCEVRLPAIIERYERDHDGAFDGSAR
jgi:hypothetical protein